MMARFISLWMGVWLAIFSVGAGAQSFSTARAGIETNANTELNRLLQIPKMAPPLWFASTDKTGGNDDFVWLAPGEKRRIALAKGTLERVWSTSLQPEKLRLDLETGPRRLFPLLRNGVARAGTFQFKAFSLHPGTQFESLRQLRDGAALVAVNESNQRVKWYYQVTVRPDSAAYIPTISVAREVAKRQFKIELPAGQTQIVENFETPGLLYELEVAVNDGSAKGVFSNVRLQMSFENRTSVDAPLLALAGEMGGEEFLTNAVSDFDGARLLLRWPMPFEKARLALKNQSDRALKLDVMARVQLFDKAPSPYRFCAIQGAEKTKKGKPVSIINLRGEGAFAGLALAIAPEKTSPRRTFAYLEGDEKIVADGRIYEGTGTEDYFSSAWYYPDKPFFLPHEGLTQKIQMPPSVAMYRFQIPDAIPFKRELNFSFEHGNKNNSDDLEWRWTAFWYQKPPMTIPANISQSMAGAQTTTPTERYSWVFLLYGGFLALLVGLVALRFRQRK